MLASRLMLNKASAIAIMAPDMVGMVCDIENMGRIFVMAFIMLLLLFWRAWLVWHALCVVAGVLCAIFGVLSVDSGVFCQYEKAHKSDHTNHTNRAKRLKIPKRLAQIKHAQPKKLKSHSQILKKIIMYSLGINNFTLYPKNAN